MRDTFTDLFQHVAEFKDLESAKEAKDLKALFETRVDQYSFVTSRETGGRYYAVTIKYRINLYTPQGEKVDSYTLTGYGNSLAMGMSGGKPLTQALWQPCGMPRRNSWCNFRISRRHSNLPGTRRWWRTNRPCRRKQR